MLSESMQAALDRMPIVYVESRLSGWRKPEGAPTAATLNALKARGLVRFVHTVTPPRWERVG